MPESYQALSAQALTFCEQLAHALHAAASTYPGAEADNALSLQGALNAVNGRTEALLGRPLIGNGANGSPGTGQNGGPGGLLLSNGGTGGSAHPRASSRWVVKYIRFGSRLGLWASRATAAAAARRPMSLGISWRRRWGDRSKSPLTRPGRPPCQYSIVAISHSGQPTA
jgi:hypothetical protein